MQIRTALGLSQSEMVKRLGVEILSRYISKWERDKGEPPIEALLAYSRVANVSLEQIVDDEADLCPVLRQKLHT
jgi:transcriptional regulator with XRE-family HTH domain